MLADTDVLIDFLRGKGTSADRVEAELRGGRLATTTVSSFELWTGAQTSRQQSAIRHLLGAMRIMSLTPEPAEIAADVHRRLAAEGRSIGMADSLIAGICLCNGQPLLTRNVEHFGRVDGLRVVAPDD